MITVNCGCDETPEILIGLTTERTYRFFRLSVLGYYSWDHPLIAVKASRSIIWMAFFCWVWMNYPCGDFNGGRARPLMAFGGAEVNPITIVWQLAPFDVPYIEVIFNITLPNDVTVPLLFREPFYLAVHHRPFISTWLIRPLNGAYFSQKEKYDLNPIDEAYQRIQLLMSFRRNEWAAHFNLKRSAAPVSA
jgi:hypothetical protein